ncbi:brefeldin A-inhibited guanine nucleotide-exchange protein 1-like [Phoenix dactylifera]|uniref:Brefeldin A-inhibited guanine nucleotide-exchange protein 1-like n=1 Tax=Phoenix dactylifera TaxID=42345 RepID=A0A8B8J1S3_PHODC|nr:brefeldin A-inhibited guanine nucleotide-exchange protein 1-like [Phoenix dactylifera]
MVSDVVRVTSVIRMQMQRDAFCYICMAKFAYLHSAADMKHEIVDAVKVPHDDYYKQKSAVSSLLSCGPLLIKTISKQGLKMSDNWVPTKLNHDDYHDSQVCRSN